MEFWNTGIVELVAIIHVTFIPLFHSSSIPIFQMWFDEFSSYEQANEQRINSTIKKPSRSQGPGRF